MACSGLDAVALALRCESLSAHVALLERKLGELHASELNSLRRAHASLCQHVGALETESEGLRTRLFALETSLWDTQLLASEVATVGAGLGFGYVFHRLIAKEPAAPFWLRIAPWILGGGAALLNVWQRGEQRWEGMALRNAARRKELLAQAELIETRVAIMRDLASPPPPAVPPPEHVGVSICPAAGEADVQVDLRAGGGPSEVAG